MKTYQPREKDIKREWHELDAKGQVLGRLATQAARLLIGKHKRNYAPHLDMGDYVIVTNASDIEVTGRKEEQKTYFRHSGYPGGARTLTFKELKERSPKKVIELAVKGMLPKNRLRDKRMGRLKVFTGSEHPYKGKTKTQE